MSSLLVSHALGITIIGYAWLAVAVIWIIGRIMAKRIAHAMPPLALALYFGLMFLCLYQLFRSPMFRESAVIPHTPELTTLGVVIFAVGLWITLWSRFALANNWSGSVAIKVDHELVEKGPYRWLRHPMYTGLISMVGGTCIVRGTPDSIMALIVFVLIHLWKLGREESLLEAHFGRKYVDYRARTKALIPYLY